MKSRQPNRKTLSALTIAAAATLVAQAAHGVTLTLYYGQETSYANSNNGIFTGQTFARTGGPVDAVGETQGLGSTVVPFSVSNATTTTIVIPVGGYLSLAIDAVLTGNANPYADISTAQNGQVQPSFIGLNELGIAISSSDAQGLSLTPLSSLKAGKPDSTIDGIPSYTATGVINQLLPANGGSSIAPVPTWPSKTGAGEVQPNLAGYDTAPNTNGGVGFDKSGGIAAFPSAGNTGPVIGNTAAGVNMLKQFTTQSNVAAYSTATDFQDNIIFQGLSHGVVTLSTFAVANSTEYWTATPGEISGVSGSPIQYNATHFGVGDVINQLPSLVVVVGERPPGHAIINLSAGPGNPPLNYGVLLTNGTGPNQGAFSPAGNKLTVTGSNGSYSLAQVTAIDGGSGASTDTVEAATFNPTTDEELFALDVLVNGTQATAAQLATLVNFINLGDLQNGIPVSNGVIATTSAPSPDPFSQNYNLFLDPSGFGDVLLGIDLSSSNDPNLVGYTFSAVAVVPEPTSLGILAVGGIALLRRSRQRNR